MNVPLVHDQHPRGRARRNTKGNCVTNRCGLRIHVAVNSYCNIEERDMGVWLECRAISLSRDIPKGLAWIVEPIIRKLPRDSLIHTLQATRQTLILERTPPVSVTENT